VSNNKTTKNSTRKKWSSECKLQQL